MIQIELFVGSEIEMKHDENRMIKKLSFQQYFMLIVGAILISFFLVGCGSMVSPDELDMVIVTTADPQYGETGDGPWNQGKEIINLVANYIAALE
jgi:hypothetical protein